MSGKNILTVSALNKYVKGLLQQDLLLNEVLIQGEISNFKNHSSGHWYFSLKDSTGVLKAVMFRGANQRVRFMPQNGMKVLVSGRVDVYERDGVYQLYAEEMLLSGAGDLYLAYEKLREQLSAEGLFDAARKRQLPKLAKNVGIATSPTGAAVQDMLSILRRRDPAVNIFLLPTVVQGAEGADSICQSLDILYQMPVDLIIVGRGGGSIEDLWCFNEEKVVRKVAAAPVPIISAVGHESDFTLCDFAADVRAATPSMAAELAVPVLSEIQKDMTRRLELLNVRYHNLLQYKAKAAEKAFSSPVLRHPEHLLENYQQRVDHLSDKLGQNAEKYLNERKHQFGLRLAKLEALSPLGVLSRGYSVCQKDGQTVNDASKVKAGEQLSVLLAKGALECVVKRCLDNEGETWRI